MSDWLFQFSNESKNAVDKQFTKLQRQSAWDLRINCNVVFTNCSCSANLRDALICWQACCQSDHNQLGYVLIVAFMKDILHYSHLHFLHLPFQIKLQKLKAHLKVEKLDGLVGWVSYGWLSWVLAGWMKRLLGFAGSSEAIQYTMYLDLCCLHVMHTMRSIMYWGGSDIVSTVYI